METIELIESKKCAECGDVVLPGELCFHDSSNCKFYCRWCGSETQEALEQKRFEMALDKIFSEAIGVEDTIWYSKTETLRDAILRALKEV